MDIPVVYLLGKEPLFCVDFLTDCKEVFLVMRDTWQCLALPLNLFCNISYLCKLSLVWCEFH